MMYCRDLLRTVISYAHIEKETVTTLFFYPCCIFQLSKPLFCKPPHSVEIL